MQNEPIHEIRFLKYLANKLSQEITQVNIMLTNEQLNGLYADVDRLRANIDKIETEANVFHKTHGSAITI
jgi:predicted transcriptional regulator